ncbi:MAG: hypothetical protein PHF63_00525 [Herbinix sp.]|nr:hypothetical protein [Herbinix sp.]
MFDIPDSYLDILDTLFDREDQLDILVEECAELIKACQKLKRIKKQTLKTSISDRDKTDEALSNLIEEMSHVITSSAYVARIFNISKEDILSEVQKKASEYSYNIDWRD